jgi:hypothetical protein
VVEAVMRSASVRRASCVGRRGGGEAGPDDGRRTITDRLVSK